MWHFISYTKPGKSSWHLPIITCGLTEILNVFHQCSVIPFATSFPVTTSHVLTISYLESGIHLPHLQYIYEASSWITPCEEHQYQAIAFVSTQCTQI